MADEDLLIRPESQSEQAGRTLPNNLEAEAAFLGDTLVLMPAVGMPVSSSQPIMA